MALEPAVHVKGWKFVDEKTGATPIALPNTFEELYVELLIAGNTSAVFTYNIPYTALEVGAKGYRQGGAQFQSASVNNMALCAVNASNSSVYIQYAASTYNGAVTDVTSTSKIRVYVK